MRNSEQSETQPPATVSLGAAIRVWTRIACLSFGGPTAQIAVMHRILVEEKRWISEQRFLEALNYCMLLPGPEAQQLATYIGWLLHRIPGAVIAGTLFVLPGLVSILVLSLVYATWQTAPLLVGAFLGIKAAILAVVFEAVLRIAKKVLHNRVMVAVAALSFFALFLFRVPFPLIILGAGLLGLLGQWWGFPQFLVLRSRSSLATEPVEAFPADSNTADDYYRPNFWRALKWLLICVVVWWSPVLLVGMIWGWDSVLVSIGLFFGQAAVVTFGGAYSVLAYIAQRAVYEFRWLTELEMADGLGLAESTPGPLIMVVQFVGFMAAYHHPEGMVPWQAAGVASLLTTWVTFVPSFLYILVGAPYVEAIRQRRELSAALSTITAAVVGVVLNLAVTLTLSTLFGSVTDWHWGPIHLPAPAFDQPRWSAVLIAASAGYLLLIRHWSLLWLLTLSIVSGVICSSIGW